jgi:transposase
VGYAWKRFRRWIKKQPDPELYKQKVVRMKAFIHLARHEHIDVYFEDEAGFSLLPYIPYGWQPIGEQGKIASKRKHVQNVVGLLNPLNGHLATYPTAPKQTIDTTFMIQCLDDFASQLKRLTVVAVDHAPWHTSHEFYQRMPHWQKQGLFIFHLPRYSPHLNLIETLWRKIKYEWLRPKDYNSPSALKKRLKEIFTEYNNEFTINFSMNVYT